MRNVMYTQEQLKLVARFAAAEDSIQEDQKVAFTTLMSAVLLGMELAESASISSQQKMKNDARKSRP